MRTRYALLIAATYACGANGDREIDLPGHFGTHWPAAEWTPSAEAPHDEARATASYADVVQKSSHNSYARYEPLLDQLLYHRVRSLELDVHRNRDGEAASPGDWFVYHEDLPLMRGSSCAMFSDCARQLAAFHSALPRHEVVTLFVDIKDGFGKGHRPEDLDAAIKDALGRENVVTPSDLLALCPEARTLREATSGKCRFPSLDELRGKFIVALTGGSSCNTWSAVSRYVEKGALERTAFVAPNTGAECPVETYDARPNIAFFNMPFSERAQAKKVRSRGLVARVYGELSSAIEFDEARASGANHVATDNVSIDRDPWSATHNERGFPFAWPARPGSLAEEGPMFGLSATSGDAWESSDSMFYAHDDTPGDQTWSALVSVPSSHAPSFAKACIMARASDAPAAPNVAVCRTFDGHAARAQIRSVAGGMTTSIDAPAFAGVNDETPAFLRLGVVDVRGGTEVTAQASVDGKNWVTITKTVIGVPLPLRGLAVASHGASLARAVFADVKRELVSGAHHVGDALDVRSLTKSAIGSDASGDAFGGVFP